MRAYLICVTNPSPKVENRGNFTEETCTLLNILYLQSRNGPQTLVKPILCRIHHGPKRAKAWPIRSWEASSRAQTKFQFFNSRRVLHNFPIHLSTQQVDQCLCSPPRSKQDPMLARPKQSSNNSHFLTSNIYVSKSKAKVM